jgi:hypothetical protein
MMGIIRFTIWVHRGADSVFGASSSPLNRDGVIVTFDDEGRARGECARLNAGSADPSRYSVETTLTVFNPSSLLGTMQ